MGCRDSFKGIYKLALKGSYEGSLGFWVLGSRIYRASKIITAVLRVRV